MSQTCFAAQDLLDDDSLLRELHVHVFVFFWPILGNARRYIWTFFVMLTFIFSKLSLHSKRFCGAKNAVFGVLPVRKMGREQK